MMKVQKNYIQKVQDCFNKKRAAIKGASSDIQELDNEYTLIHSFFEKLVEDQHIDSEHREEKLKDYLKGIANGENPKFSNRMLKDMVHDVCIKMCIIDPANKLKP